MGSFKAFILGLHNRAHYLISNDDSLKTIKETKAVQNSLNFIWGIESLRALRSRREFFPTSTSLINGIKVVWIAIVGKMLILPKKIDKWDSPVMFEGLGGK